VWVVLAQIYAAEAKLSVCFLPQVLYIGITQALDKQQVNTACQLEPSVTWLTSVTIVIHHEWLHAPPQELKDREKVAKGEDVLIEPTASQKWVVSMDSAPCLDGGS
jgi:hypothetical protein